MILRQKMGSGSRFINGLIKVNLKQYDNLKTMKGFHRDVTQRPSVFTVPEFAPQESGEGL